MGNTNCLITHEYGCACSECGGEDSELEDILKGCPKVIYELSGDLRYWIPRMNTS